MDTKASLKIKLKHTLLRQPTDLKQPDQYCMCTIWANIYKFSHFVLTSLPKYNVNYVTVFTNYSLMTLPFIQKKKEI